MKNEAAKAASMIRKHLKANGIQARVKSRVFSMGSSVDVTLLGDYAPAIVKAVSSYCGDFQYGHFDGMTDCYHSSNRNDSLPQAKFVHVAISYSDELRAAARDYVANIRGIEAYEIDQYVWQVLNGSWGSFWRDRKPRVRLAA
jgi:hypothetical protein